MRITVLFFYLNLFSFNFFLVKNSRRNKSPVPNKRQFNERNDGDQELAAYSQIFVPGLISFYFHYFSYLFF